MSRPRRPREEGAHGRARCPLARSARRRVPAHQDAAQRVAAAQPPRRGAGDPRRHGDGRGGRAAPTVGRARKVARRCGMEVPASPARHRSARRQGRTGASRHRWAPRGWAPWPANSSAIGGTEELRPRRARGVADGVGDALQARLAAGGKGTERGGRRADESPRRGGQRPVETGVRYGEEAGRTSAARRMAAAATATSAPTSTERLRRDPARPGLRGPAPLRWPRRESAVRPRGRHGRDREPHSCSA